MVLAPWRDLVRTTFHFHTNELILKWNYPAPFWIQPAGGQRSQLPVARGSRHAPPEASIRPHPPPPSWQLSWEDCQIHRLRLRVALLAVHRRRRRCRDIAAAAAWLAGLTVEALLAKNLERIVIARFRFFKIAADLRRIHQWIIFRQIKLRDTIVGCTAP